MNTSKKIWGWFFYDWACQPYNTLMVTFIIGPYFATVAAEYFITCLLYTSDAADE